MTDSPALPDARKLDYENPPAKRHKTLDMDMNKENSVLQPKSETYLSHHILELFRFITFEQDGNGILCNFKFGGIEYSVLLEFDDTWQEGDLITCRLKGCTEAEEVQIVARMIFDAGRVIDGVAQFSFRFEPIGFSTMMRK